jgi:hypothetical protein
MVYILNKFFEYKKQGYNKITFLFLKPKVFVREITNFEVNVE